MPGGAKPKRMGYHYEKAVEDFIRKQAGISATRTWGSGAGRENPKVDIATSSPYFPATLQVKHKELPRWLGDDLKTEAVEAVVACEAGGGKFITLELGLFIHYCGLPKEE